MVSGNCIIKDDQVICIQTTNVYNLVFHDGNVGLLLTTSFRSVFWVSDIQADIRLLIFYEGKEVVSFSAHSDGLRIWSSTDLALQLIYVEDFSFCATVGP